MDRYEGDEAADGRGSARYDHRGEGIASLGDVFADEYSGNMPRSSGAGTRDSVYSNRPAPPDLCPICYNAESVPEFDSEGRQRLVPCVCVLARHVDEALENFERTSELGYEEARATFDTHDVNRVKDPAVLRAKLLLYQVAAGAEYLVSPTVDCPTGLLNTAINELDAVISRATNVPSTEHRTELAAAMKAAIERTIAFRYLGRGRDALKRGVFLIGAPGAGKSHLLVATGRAAIKNGLRASFLEARVLDMRMEDAHKAYPPRGSRGVEGTLSQFVRETDMLLLDDLGTEDSSEQRWRDVFNLVSMARARRTTLIVATNLTRDMIEKRYDQRLISRIQEMCVVVEYEYEKEPDHRTEDPPEQAQLG